MRWLATVLVCALACSVKAQAEEEQPFLKIIANPTIVYNVDEIRAIFCNSSIEPIEWYSPKNKKIEKKSSTNTRVYVEKMAPLFGVPLMIRSIKISDAGNWTCKAGELSASIDIIVGDKVIIKERNVEMNGDEGKAVRMTCEAKGYPAPNVVWYKDNSPIINDHKKYLIRNDNSLEIKKLDHMDIGAYVCKVRQKALSHYTDKTVHLSVQHKPVFYNSNTRTLINKYKAEEVYAILNETKNITCSALANPLPTYHWIRTHDGYDDEEITDPDMVAHSEDGSQSVLMLRMEDETVLGQYKCTSKNSKGTESIVFHVSLGTKPDPPDFVAVVTSNTTDIAFNVSCSTCLMGLGDEVSQNPENLTITGYAFELVPHKEHFEPDWDAAHHVEVTIENQNDTLFVVGGLANTTQYHVRVASINAAGYSEWYVAPGLAKTAKAFRLAATALLILTSLIFTFY